MKSDLAAARLHLERAFYYLCGDDRFSQNARTTIDAMMDQIVAPEKAHAAGFGSADRLCEDGKVELPRELHQTGNPCSHSEAGLLVVVNVECGKSIFG
jgi:hypothetical protein